ncbi:nuclear transport factor 2 family protein [Halosimplex amylolyticum]|uniref:nuclear transport factor 2 family protein n=1 Tax=Halosimplex amylolyticum TaxID=3396616 RepID=UPI003F5765AB
MGAADRVRAYYDALRAGEALAPFFAPGEDVVKVGISERLVGGEEVADGLRQQTETTTGWSVESRDLRVTERDRHAWFADRVSLAWTDTDRQIRYEFDTRWSGTLERREADEPTDPDEDEQTDAAASDERWQFVGMHVSTARDLG